MELHLAATPTNNKYLYLAKRRVGELYAAVNFSLPESSPFKSIPLAYNLLDHTPQAFLVDGIKSFEHVAFGVLNFNSNDSKVILPRTCLAVALLYTGDMADVPAFGKLTRIHTVAPIVFHRRIQKDKGSAEDTDKPLSVSDVENDCPIGIYRDKLAKHKMRLVNAYL